MRTVCHEDDRNAFRDYALLDFLARPVHLPRCRHPFSRKARPMPDPADADHRLHAALDALTVASARVQLTRRRIAAGPFGAPDPDGALTLVDRALERLKGELHRLEWSERPRDASMPPEPPDAGREVR